MQHSHTFTAAAATAVAPCAFQVLRTDKRYYGARDGIPAFFKRKVRDRSFLPRTSHKLTLNHTVLANDSNAEQTANKLFSPFASKPYTSSSSSTSSLSPLRLPPLNCPGGPRMRAEGIKNLFKVPHAGIVAKYDQRFILNLKLTHQLASYLSRTTLKSEDKVLLELGPGPGTLTRSLLTRPCVGVLGIEKDERFNAYLEQIKKYTNDKFKWFNGDVLELDEMDCLRAAFPEFVERNRRRRPGGDAGKRSFNRETSSSTSSSSYYEREEEEYSWNGKNNNKYSSPEEEEEEEDMVYEGAPLRSTRRERILRERAKRHCERPTNSTHVPYNTEHEHFKHSHHTHKENTFASTGEESKYKHEYEETENQARWNDRETIRNHTSPNAAFDISDHWWADGEAKLEVIANLPFDVITELLMRYAVDCSRKSGIFIFGRVPLHIFTQKEVADRITAPAGSIYFSRLSVLTQCYFHVRLKQSFTEMTYFPRTEVRGAMLTLEPRSVALVSHLDGATLTHFTNLLMKPGQRGWSVHKALNKFMPPEVVQYVLQEFKMDGALTVLDLTVEEICGMAKLWRNFLQASQQQQQQQQQQCQQQEQEYQRYEESKYKMQ